METYPQPHQPAPLLALPHHAYYQLVHTLDGILPPPVNETPEALLARTQAAIDEVAAMLPTNANEARFAAQCVTARAQADDVMRLLRKHAGDIKLAVKLNAQYIAMARASQGAHSHLQRAQAVRHKREKSDAALKADEWTQYTATREMQQALEAGPGRAAQAVGQAVPAPPVQAQLAPVPEPAPVVQPPAPALAPPPSASVLAEAPPPPLQAAAPTPPPMPAPVAGWPPTPAAPAQTPPLRRPRHTALPAEADESPRDLLIEADQYALTYPRRAREIRRYGGLPPDCSYGPPDDDLARALATGTSPVLCELDDMSTAAD